MVKQGKGWLLVGSSPSEQLARAKAAELTPKGFETSVNRAVIVSSRGNPDKTVFKVWAKDKGTEKRYKPDGRRRW
jgi:hypothetical protein